MQLSRLISGPWRREPGMRQTPESRRRQASVRSLLTDDHWRYSWHETGEEELYHLAEDPREYHNLAYDANHQGQIGEYRAGSALGSVVPGM